jgi:hypothetical protein
MWRSGNRYNLTSFEHETTEMLRTNRLRVLRAGYTNAASKAKLHRSITMVG